MFAVSDVTKKSFFSEEWGWLAKVPPDTETHFLLPPQIPESSSFFCPWQQQLPILVTSSSFLCAVASMAPSVSRLRVYILTYISSFESPGHTSVHLDNLISPGIFHCHTTYKQLEPPIATSQRWDPFGTYVGLSLSQSFPAQASSRHTLKVQLTGPQTLLSTRFSQDRTLPFL